MKKESTAFRPSQGFTLIELLVLVATIAILAAVLFPVFAQAKLSAKTASTGTNLRQVGQAALLYTHDYDQGVVLTCQGEGDDRGFWPAVLNPYTKDRQVFFDPARPTEVKDRMELAPRFVEPWGKATTFAINNGGYAGYWTPTTGTCSGKIVSSGFHYGSRTMPTMMEPEARVAFAPNAMFGPNTGWYYFQAHLSNLYDLSKTPTSLYSNTIYRTRENYAAKEIPVVHADGSLGKLLPKDFANKLTTPTATWCKWLNDQGGRTWGRFWMPN